MFNRWRNVGWFHHYYVDDDDDDDVRNEKKMYFEFRGQFFMSHICLVSGFYIFFLFVCILFNQIDVTEKYDIKVSSLPFFLIF